MANREITYSVGFNINTAQLNQLKSQLSSLQKLSAQDLLQANPTINLDLAKQQLTEIKKSAGEVQTALSAAFNPKLGDLNISKLQEQFKNLDIGKIYSDFSKAGAEGIKAFDAIPSAVMKTNLQLRESHSLLDKIGTTFTNSIKWGITSRVVNGIADSIQGAWNYTKALDSSLNDIRIVTGKSADEMERFAVQANRAAQNLGANTKDYTNAALIYYQQGLDDAEAQARASVTVKTANVTGQSAREASEQLTAIWNGYKVNAAEAELYIDKVAKVAATTAADLEELSTGMSKVASAANLMGVDVDQLNAQLATIVSVTRQAPESVGTALKTIFARISDIKSGLDDETTLGNYTSKMAEMGVNVLTSTGQLRDMGGVIEEIGEKWTSMSREQQIALAQTMAGQRQYNNLLALFDNWDMYEKALNDSRTATGELQKQQDIYMESTSAHLKTLSASWERVFDSFVDNKGINQGIDVLTGLTNGLANFIESLGGGGNALLTFGSIFTRIFSKQIAEGFSATIKNAQAAKYNLQQVNGVIETLQKQQESYINSKQNIEHTPNQAIATRITSMQALKERLPLMSNEQVEQGIALANAQGTAQNNLDAWNREYSDASKQLATFMEHHKIMLTQTELEEIMTGKNTIAWTKYDQAIEKNNEELQSYREHIAELKQAQEEYKKSLDEVTQAENKYGKKSDEAKAARQKRDQIEDNLKGKFNTVKEDMKSLNGRQDLSETTLENVDAIVNTTLKNVKTNTKQGLADLANDTQGIIKATSDAVDSVKKDFDDLGDTIDKTGDKVANGVPKQLEQEANAANNSMKNFLDSIDTTAASQQFINLASSVGQLASAYQILTNLPEIWDDKELSSGEKVLQTVTALTTALPLLAIGFKTAKSSLVGVAGAFKFVSGAELEAASSAGIFSTAFWTAAGPVLGVLALIAASITAVAVIVNAGIKSYNETADAAAAAERQAQSLTQSFEECNQAVTDLYENIEDYDSSLNALNTLEKGTEEYTKALEEANTKAKELIETYDLVSGQDYTVDSNGLIKVKTGEDSQLENKKQELEARANQANQAQLAAQMKNARAQIDSERLNYQRATGINYASDEERLYTALNATMALVPVIGPLLQAGGEIARNTSEQRGYNLDNKEVNELSRELLATGEGYETVLGQSEDNLRQWILNNDNLSDSVKQDVDRIVEEKDALISLISTTKEYNDVLMKANADLTISHMENNKELNDRIRNMAIDKDTGEVNETRVELIQRAIANSSEGQALAGEEDTSLELARLDAKRVKSNNDLEEFAKRNKLNADELGLTNLNDEKSAKAYLKHVLGYTDEDLTHMKIEDNWGSTSVKWDSEYTDSKGTGHKADDYIYKDLNDEEARSTIAYQVQAKEIAKTFDEIAEEGTIDVTNSISTMLKSGEEAATKYGVDFSNIILNAMSGRDSNGNNADLDFSNYFDELTDAEVEALVKLDSKQLAKMLGLSEEDFMNMGWDGAEAFEKAFDEGILEHERAVLAELMQNITSFGQGGSDLSDEQLSSLSSSLVNKLSTEQMQALSSNSLALGQIDFSTENLDKVGEQLSFMSEQIRKATEDGVALTQAQKDEAKELDYSEKALKAYAEELENSNEALKDNDEMAADLALANVRMNKGINDLANNWEHWSAVLKEGNKNSGEYYEVLSQLKEAASNMFGVEVSNEFITAEDHLEKLGQIAEGNISSFDELQKAAAVDYVTHLDVVAPDQATVNNIRNELLGMVQDIQNQSNIEIGTTLDPSYVDQLNEMLRKGQITEEQMNNILGSIGYHPTTHYETIPGPETKTHHRVTADIFGQEIQVASFNDYTQSDVQVPVIEGGSGDTSGTAPTYVGKPSSSGINYSNGAGRKAANSGGGSKKEPDTMDKLDDEPDRYHKVDTQLEKISNQLDLIQFQEKKFTGAKLIQNLNQQLDKLDDRIDNLREKQKIAYGEMNELQQKLGAQGVKFNDDGTIANYMEIYNSKLNYVNGLIDKYNSMSADEQEKYKETVEKAKEDYDEFKEQLDYYDKLVSDTIPGISNDIQDSLDEEIELKIKKFDLEFDIQLNLKDANLEWNEFKKKILDGIKDDDIFGNARARAVDDMSVYLDENGNGFLSQATKRSQRVLEEIKKLDETGYSDVYGDDRQSALDALKASYQEINNALLEMDEIQKDVYQAWLDTMDDISDQMQEQVDMYEQIHDIVDHDMKVIKLVYGESDYESLGKYYEQQHNNYLGLLDFQRQNVEFWENEMNSIQDKNSDAFKKARNNWMSAVKDLEGTVEDSIENAQAKMENAINDTFQKFNDKITDGKGLDYVKQQWDLINDVEDDYLDKVNSAFGIRQLERKYLDAIDQTDNVSNQRKLNKLMEDELAKLREKDKLTEYDIERANKRYEIELKRLALEEAQQTKNTMRLRRDSQGNYRYEYVADEENIRKLQDELDVLENELYNFDKERWLEMQNQVVDAVQERQDAIKEILMDASLSEEERAERLAEINELYNQKIQDITDQTVTAQNNLYESGATELGKIWDEEGKDFNELNQEIQRQMVEEMLPQFEAGVNQMIDKFNGPGGFEEQTTESMEALSQKTQDYRQDLEDIETQAGYSFDAIEQGYDKVIPKSQELLENNDKLLENYGKQLKAIEELNKELDKHIKKYESIKQKAIEATQAAHDYWAEAQKQDAEDAANDPGQGGEPGKTDNGKQPTTTTDKDKGNNGGGKGSGNGTPEVGDVVTYTGGLYYYDSYGTAPAGSRGPGKKVTITSVNSGAPYPIHVKSNDSAYGWLKKNQLQGYDTGGYTGDWAGDYGIPILAHKKELMLNKDDTANMLNIVGMVRDIVSMAGPRVGTLSANSNAINSAAAALEQNVHIDANFPNVESAAEIEQALNNLVNLAAQRASRNTRG